MNLSQSINLDHTKKSPRKIILFGAPGAGKGTQTKEICNALSVHAVSTGDMIRQSLKNSTPFEQKMSLYIKAGKLLPDAIIIDLIKERLLTQDCKNGFVLDGFPRTISQAKALENMDVKIDLVISLEIKDSLIIKRMSGRRVCSICGMPYHIVYNKPKVENICDVCGGRLIKRVDDGLSVIKQRLEVYHSLTEPLKDFYRKKRILVSVTAEGDVVETTSLVLKTIGID